MEIGGNGALQPRRVQAIAASSSETAGTTGHAWHLPTSWQLHPRSTTSMHHPAVLGIEIYLYREQGQLKQFVTAASE